MHWCVAVLSVEHVGLAPAWANVVGWLCAFVLSFAGHWRWTFAGRGAPWHRALARFFALSAFGFAINMLAYALVLRLGALRYDVALAAVLLGVALFTYLAAHWAFRGA
jgi:putative flippase GtrA